VQFRIFRNYRKEEEKVVEKGAITRWLTLVFGASPY
jgi:hypothetical protein